MNSRDLKGWTCTCIAVFHDSRKTLQLLLEAGGDPNIRSTYNKNAWDLAKDELDAAENIVRSRAEIRQVLIDYDTTAQKSNLFGTKVGTGGADADPNRAQTNKYKDLGPDGSPVDMQEELNKEMMSEKAKGAGETGGSGGAKKKGVVGGKKAGTASGSGATKKGKKKKA